MKNLRNEAQNIRMTPEEKQAMRLAVFGAPMQEVSPYYSFFTISAFMNIRSAVAAMLLFALVGSSTAYAAEGALPGDLLYPIKISINENVVLALATTPDEKIETETRLAERRVAEAQALEDQGRLNTEVSVKIEEEFDKHAARALMLAEGTGADVEVAVLEDENHSAKSATSAADSRLMAMNVEPTTTVMMATTAASTSEVRSHVRASLEVQKELLKKLKERAQLREGRKGVRGEVQGVGTWESNDEDEDPQDKEEEKGSGDKKEGEEARVEIQVTL